MQFTGMIIALAGIALTCTVIGAIIGIPMILAGGVLFTWKK